MDGELAVAVPWQGTRGAGRRVRGAGHRARSQPHWAAPRASRWPRRVLGAAHPAGVGARLPSPRRDAGPEKRHARPEGANCSDGRRRGARGQKAGDGRARHHCHFRGGPGRGRAPVPFKALSISVSCGRNFRKRDTNRRAQGHLDRTLGRRYRETSKRPATTPGAAKRSAKCLLPGKDVNSEGDYFFPSRQRLWRNLSVGESEDSSGLNFQSSVKKGWEGKMTPKQRAGRRDLLLFMGYSAS